MHLLDDSLAFVFPGQGSQSVGMLIDLAAAYPEVERTFAAASRVLELDLWRLTCQGPPEELNLTQNTQPIMLAAGVAIWNVWRRKSQARPAWMAGHSLGEYSALVCAGALAFEDALKLVAARAHLMQEAVSPDRGAMAAILGLEDYQVIQLCDSVRGDEIVSAVNFNAPGQVVIAGHRVAVERAIEAAKEKGAKRVVLLPISVPSHCELMRPAAEKLYPLLQRTEFKTPEIPVVHNVDVSAHDAPGAIRSALMQQLYSPVRWVDTIQFLRQQGVMRFVECGPGKVLTGLNKRIVRDCESQPVFDLASLHKLLEFAV